VTDRARHRWSPSCSLAAVGFFFSAATLAIFATSCSPDPVPTLAQPTDTGPEAPGQADALGTILRSYGAPALLGAPAVRWKRDGLDCASGQGWVQSSGLDRARCIRGMFETDQPAQVTVATWEGAAFPQVSIAHEVLHWLLYTTTGDPNQDHTGNFYARVNAANAALWAARDGEPQ
jgi:hypothetical protein